MLNLFSFCETFCLSLNLSHILVYELLTVDVVVTIWLTSRNIIFQKNTFYLISIVYMCNMLLFIVSAGLFKRCFIILLHRIRCAF